MKRKASGLAWAAFLFLAGLFLLLKNLDVLGQWGEPAWGGLFVLAGLGFLIWLLTGLRQWWRALPAFILLAAGAMILLEWQGIDLGGWDRSIMMFGVALGFWAALLLQRENWWALIPAGVLTLIGGLTGIEASLSPLHWRAAFYAGLGLVFALLYLVRARQGGARWAGVPAAALVLLGIVTLASGALTAGSSLPELAVKLLPWWPVLLAASGVLVLALSLRRPAPVLLKTTDVGEEPIQAARGTSVVEMLPAAAAPPRRTGAGQGPILPAAPVSAPLPAPATNAGAPAAAAPVETAGGKPVDIYEMIRNQPPEPAPQAASVRPGPTEAETPPATDAPAKSGMVG